MKQNMENERRDIRTLAEKYDKLQTLMCYVNKETLMEQHKISRKKKKAKKQAIKQWLKDNMHENLVNIIERLNRKLTGMYAYYGINGMFKDLMGLYKYTKYELYRVMCRRSQKKIKK